MPPLPEGHRYPWFKRYLPDRIFYLVPALMWLSLSLRHRSLTLPTVANPQMEVGGLWGERKSQGMTLFGPTATRHLAPCVTVTRSAEPAGADLLRAEAALEAEGITFPIVAKPDRGYQGWGVRIVPDPASLQDYLAEVPEGAGLMLQALIPFSGEAGIFYIREPGRDRGRIVSMALTYAPHVLGDGQRSLSALIEEDRVLRQSLDSFRATLCHRWDDVPPAGRAVPLTNTRSARLGAVYLDATHLVTPELEDAVAVIAADVADFHFGRFDIRFRSLDDLRQGTGFQIVELNGAGAEMLHIWAIGGTLRRAYATLWRQYRTLFRIGAKMRRKGHRPAGLATMIPLQRLQERLRRTYPTSG